MIASLMQWSDKWSYKVIVEETPFVPLILILDEIMGEEEDEYYEEIPSSPMGLANILKRDDL